MSRGLLQGLDPLADLGLRGGVEIEVSSRLYALIATGVCRSVSAAWAREKSACWSFGRSFTISW